MKKKILIIILIVAVACVALGVVLSLSKKKENTVGIEDYVASGAIFFGRLNHVEKNWSAFLASAFWKELSQINWVKVLQESKTDPQAIEQIKQSINSAIKAGENPLVKDFFGQEMAVIVYPFSAKQSTDNPQALLENFIFVTRLKPQANIMEAVTSYFYSVHKDKNVPVVTENYKGQTITRVQTPQQVEISYVKIGDYMIAGFAPKYIKAAVDVLKKGKTLPLSQDPRFIQAKSLVAPLADGFVLFDIEATLAQFQPYLKSLATGPNLQGMQQFFDQTDGLKLYVLSFYPGPVLHVQSRVTMNKNLMKPQIREQYEFSKTKNESIHFVPSNAVGYQWGNFYNFEEQWRQMKMQMGMLSAGQGNVDETISQIEKQLGISIENDLLPILGNEIGGYLSGVDTSGMFPMPQLSLFIKIKDIAKAEKLMTNLLAKNSFILMKKEEHRNVDVNYFTIPLGTPVEPGYAFIGDYLVFATSRELLKSALDAKAGQSNLSADANFTQLDPGLSKDNNYIFYLRGDLLAQALQSLVVWADNWTASRLGQTEAFKSGAAQKLEEIRADTLAKEEKIKSIQETLKVLDAEVAQIESETGSAIATEGVAPGVSLPMTLESDEVMSKKAQMATLRDELSVLDKERVDLVASEPEYQENIKIFDQQLEETEKFKFALREIVGPVLKSIETIKSTSSRMNFNGNTLEAEVYLKLK